MPGTLTVVSDSVTPVTAYLWNQSEIGLGRPGGVHLTGKHRPVFCAGSVVTGATQSLAGVYSTPIVVPVSVVTALIRIRVNGTNESGPVSTRFTNACAANDAAGRVIGELEPPAVMSCPVRAIPESHNVGIVAFPVLGNVCVKAQESTGT